MMDVIAILLFFAFGMITGIVVALILSGKHYFTIVATNNKEYERKVIGEIHKLQSGEKQ